MALLQIICYVILINFEIQSVVFCYFYLFLKYFIQLKIFFKLKHKFNRS